MGRIDEELDVIGGVFDIESVKVTFPPEWPWHKKLRKRIYYWWKLRRFR